MTVITPAAEYTGPDDVDPRRDALLRRRVLEEQQTEALRRRLTERAQPRVQKEEKLASSRSPVEANEPVRYYNGDELQHPRGGNKQMAKTQTSRREAV
jgi:hypothetical protein